MIITSSIKQNRCSFPKIAILSIVLNMMQMFIQHDFAYAEKWDSLPLYGGEMTSIVMDSANENTIYVGTKDAGVFKTTDGGISWQPARNGLTFMPTGSLVMDPNNSNVLYAGTDFHGIWKTINGGDSWFYAGSGLDTGKAVTSIVINPQNTQIIYAGLRSGYYGNIYKSEDGGVSWVRKDNGLPVYSGIHTHNVVTITIDPVVTGTLYAGTTWDGAFKTTDGGDNWQAINCGIPIWNTTFDEVQALALDPHNSNRLSGIINGDYYIFNATDCWEKVGEQAGFGFSTHHLYFHPTDSSILFSAGGGQIGYFSKSTDGGQTWLPSGGRLNDVNEIAFHSSHPNTIYAATVKYGDEWDGFTSGGVYKTGDGGTTWSEATSGITARVISNVGIDPQDPDIIYTIVGADTNTLLLKSQDGGQTWQQGDNFSESSFSFIAVNPQMPQQVYLGTWGFGDLYFSNDSGQNFNTISEVSGGPTSIAFDPVSSDIIYVGSSQNGIYKSIDSGSTWTQKNNGLPSYSFGDAWVDSVAVDPNNNSVVWAGTNGREGIFKSEDGGENWVLEGLDEFTEDVYKIQTIAINPNNSNTILIGAGYTQDNIWKTTNGGNSWVSTLSSGVNVEEIIYDPRDSNIVYAATAGSGVLRSTDGGETWQDYSNGIFYPVVYSLEVTNDNPPLLVAGSYGSGLYSLCEKITVTPLSDLRTTEEGDTASFTVVLTNQPTSDVSIGLSSSDITEGTVSPDSLVFNTVNWDIPRAVTVTGVDDSVNDGDIAYTITTAAAVSLDMEYNGRDACDVRVTNVDNDDLLCFPIKSKSGKIAIICM